MLCAGTAIYSTKNTYGMAVKCCVRCLEASWRLERVDKLVWRGRKLSCVSRVCWPGCGVAPFWWLMHKRTAFPSRTYRQANRRGLTLPRPEIMSLIWFFLKVRTSYRVVLSSNLNVYNYYVIEF